LTHKKQKAKLHAAAARRAGACPYPPSKPRLGGIGAEVLERAPGPGCLPSGRSKLRVFLAQEMSDLAGDAEANRCCHFVQSVKVADLIIVGAASDIEVRRDHSWLYILTLIVAFGKPVLCRNNWTLPRPDKSKDIVRHQAAMLTARLLVCSPEFQQKHQMSYRVLKICADAKVSKWQLRDDLSEVEAARCTKSRMPVHLRNIADVFVFYIKSGAWCASGVLVAVSRSPRRIVAPMA